MGHYPPQGSRNRGFDLDDDDFHHRVPPTGDRSRTGSPFGLERSYVYQSDERYWTDYLRIAAPVLGVILMLGLAWFWITRALGGDDGTNVQPTATGTAMVPIVTDSTPSPRSSTAPELHQTPPPASPSAGPGVLAPGARAVVTGTGGSGVNLRAEPTTDAEIVATLADGTELTITGEKAVGDDYTWWPVETTDYSGYLVEDFIELVE